MPISDDLTTPTRRDVTLGLLASALVVMLPARSHADAVSRAQGLVGNISAELTRLVNSGRGTEQLYGEFERILNSYADMPVVAASVLGQPWREASSAQKQNYVGAFRHYLSRKYGRQFGNFRNANIRVTGGRDAGRAGALIRTIVERPGQETITVDWQISERGGSPKAVNLIIEGVSMLAAERAEIGAMLDAQGGNIDGLIAQMRARG